MALPALSGSLLITPHIDVSPNKILACLIPPWCLLLRRLKLTYFPTPLLMLPGITSLKNNLHSNLCVNICFWGSQPTTEGITEKVHTSLPLKALQQNVVTWPGERGGWGMQSVL